MMEAMGTLYKKVESANKWTNKRGRSAGYYYSNYKKKWVQQLALVFPRKDREKAPPVAGRITITAFNSRLFDADNLRGGTKAICDYFVRAGYFYDDRPEFLTVNVIQEKVPRKAEYTTITIIYPK